MSYLEGILSRKAEEVEARRRATPEEVLEAQAAARGGSRGGRLFDALSEPGGPTRVIAEVKRASPSRGSLASGLDATAQARAYAAGRAAAISVLTDGPGFGGSLADLGEARTAVDLPLLRKDFVLDRYQLLEAKAAGADAILLIVAALRPAALVGLLAEAAQLGLDALVEVHDEGELEVALAARASLIGINNRSLATFEVDLSVSERLATQLPPTVKAVAESGVRSADDVRRLRGAGLSNFLIGEALVRSADPVGLLAELRAAR